MFNWRKKLINITILAILIVGLCFLGANGNGQSEEVKYNIPASTYRDIEEDEEIGIGTDEAPPVKEESEQKQTDLTVLLVDGINGSRIVLKNCILQLVGEMPIAEDMFTYSNTFYDGNIYKITVLVELRDDEEKLK